MVFSDHKPLKNFFEGGMDITKLDRWSLELQEFDISLEFIQGKLNTVINVISYLKNGGLYQEHSNTHFMVTYYFNVLGVIMTSASQTKFSNITSGK